MKKDILIIAHFMDEFKETSNNRFNYLADYLSKDEECFVEVITSDFLHPKKIKRNKMKATKNVNYKLTLLKEPIYKKNISVKRCYAHYILGKNLKKYLEKREKPDVIYCAVPSLSFAKKAAIYAKKNNIKFIIDIQDLWPEAFQMVLPTVISKVLFYPMKRKADYIYNSANEIIAVSETYVRRAKQNNKEEIIGNSIFIGTDLEKFDNYIESSNVQLNKKNEILIVYTGTLGHSYDLYTIFDSLSVLQKKGENRIKFIVIGDGPLKNEFQKYAKDLEINVDFVGRLDYKKTVSLLKQCDIAVNPIVKSSVASIINKHADYAAAGLPVINTQTNFEYRELLDKHYFGFNCKNGDSLDVAEKINILINDKELRKLQGDNSRTVAEKYFNRKKTYGKIKERILNDMEDKN